MIKSISVKLVFGLVGIFTSFFVIPLADAQDKVVVVPLMGKSAIELTRVSATYRVDNFVSSCHTHGNLPCFVGSGTVTCPEGMGVLGGGVNADSAHRGSISRSYPNSETSWTCSSSYENDLSGVNDTCYAICAPMK